MGNSSQNLMVHPLGSVGENTKYEAKAPSTNEGHDKAVST